MNQPVHAIHLNRTLLWLVPLVAIAFFALNKPTTTFFNVTEVSVLEARALVDSGAIVVDVREKEAFRSRHLPGAISAPVSQLRSEVPVSLSEAKDKPVVVYCGDGATMGPEGTQLLNNAGYARAVNMKSGIDGWQKAGYPIER